MPIYYATWINKTDIQANRDVFFVFGDNLEGWGRGGQAKECRGEPNAIGIPTKRSPNKFLTDDDLDEWLAVTAATFVTLREALKNSVIVIWPRAGIGTGFARLESQAPKIWKQLQLFIADLEKIERDVHIASGSIPTL